MIDKDKKPFILKALDDNIDTHFEFYFNIVKTKDLKKFEDDAIINLAHNFYAKTMSNAWVINLYIAFPFLNESSTLDVTRTFYTLIKRYDINNLLSIVSYLDSDSSNEYAIKISVDPDFIVKKIIAEGFIARTGLGVDIEIIQEELSEYRYTFKNIDFLDNFVAFFKDVIRDSSYAAI